jgi:hypothetical protein
MNNHPAREHPTADRGMGTREAVLQNIKRRYYRALNYLSIYVFIIVVYGGALLTEYALFALMTWLLRDDVAKYSLVAIWFDYARIGLALLFIFSGVAHGIISTVGQIRLDLALSREGDAG